MPGHWGPEERRALQLALRQEAPLRCPACGGAVARSEVPAKRELPYVRRRALLICTACGASAAFDLPVG